MDTMMNSTPKPRSGLPRAVAAALLLAAPLCLPLRPALAEETPKSDTAGRDQLAGREQMEQRLKAAQERMEQAAHEMAEMSLSLNGGQDSVDRRVKIVVVRRPMLGMSIAEESGGARAGAGVRVLSVSPGGRHPRQRRDYVPERRLVARRCQAHRAGAAACHHEAGQVRRADGDRIPARRQDLQGKDCPEGRARHARRSGSAAPARNAHGRGPGRRCDDAGDAPRDAQFQRLWCRGDGRPVPGAGQLLWHRKGAAGGARTQGSAIQAAGRRCARRHRWARARQCRARAADPGFLPHGRDCASAHPEAETASRAQRGGAVRLGSAATGPRAQLRSGGGGPRILRMQAPPALQTWLLRAGGEPPRAAPFLPMSRAEMAQLGWEQCDVIIVTGDAYVDHPSFGAALIGRVLEAQGLRVGIIAQPDWHGTESFRALGEPRLFFGVTAGNMDSMVNRYTADRRVRSDDAYTPGGKGGRRPDRSVIVYAQRVREAYRDATVVIGSIEASLRRIAHYDYWSEKVRRSEA